MNGPNMDDVKRRFEQEVQLRAFDDRYIDKTEELAILQYAIQSNVTVESARSALAQVCESNGYILESAVLKQAREMLAQFAAKGKIDEKEFNDAVGILRRATQGKRTELQIKLMLLQIMQEEAHQPRTGMFTNWHARARKEAGMS